MRILIDSLTESTNQVGATAFSARRVLWVVYFDLRTLLLTLEQWWNSSQTFHASCLHTLARLDYSSTIQCSIFSAWRVLIEGLSWLREFVYMSRYTTAQIHRKFLIHWLFEQKLLILRKCMRYPSVWSANAHCVTQLFYSDRVKRIRWIDWWVQALLDSMSKELHGSSLIGSFNRKISMWE